MKLLSKFGAYLQNLLSTPVTILHIIIASVVISLTSCTTDIDVDEPKTVTEYTMNLQQIRNVDSIAIFGNDMESLDSAQAVWTRYGNDYHTLELFNGNNPPMIWSVKIEADGSTTVRFGNSTNFFNNASVYADVNGAVLKSADGSVIVELIYK